MATPMDGIVTANREMANRALSQASSIASRIRINDGIASINKHDLKYTFNKPYIREPILSLSELLPNNVDNDLIKFLDGLASQWVEKYFPRLTECLRTSPEDWLCKVINGIDPYGNSSLIFNSIWNQARDNAYKTGNSTKNQIYTDFSNRGFSIPNGALMASIYRAEEQVNDLIADANRDAMQSAIQLQADLLKFALEEAIKLKIGIISALGEFYNNWLKLPNNAVELAKAKASIVNSYYNALASYYDVEIALEKLSLEAAGKQLDSENDYEKLKVAAYQPDHSFNSAVANASKGFSELAGQAISSNSVLVANLESSTN